MACHRILIIEDEPDLRETLKDLLELSGFKVAAAENGKEGLKLLLEEMEKTCLILLDLMMPVMNGWQFLEALKNEHQHLLDTIPLVVVSAAADLTDLQQQHGCRVMKKPANIEHLVTLAREHCEAC